MVRFSSAMVVSVVVINLGTMSASMASLNGRNTRADTLQENWEKEEELADLLNDMIASSKTASPTTTNVPSLVRAFIHSEHYTFIIIMFSLFTFVTESNKVSNHFTDFFTQQKTV
jgi:hypothetical protein